MQSMLLRTPKYLSQQQLKHWILIKGSLIIDDVEGTKQQQQQKLKELIQKCYIRSNKVN